MDIVEDTGNPDLAINFLSDYVLLLQMRMSRILAALNLEDPEASRNAVLSLKTASQIAGALEIAECCGDLLPAVAAHKFQLARELATVLRGIMEQMAAASRVLLE